MLVPFEALLSLQSLAWIVSGLIVLDVPTPAPGVYPRAGNGIATYVLGGFFGVGLLMLVMFLLGLKPRRADPPTRND